MNAAKRLAVMLALLALAGLPMVLTASLLNAANQMLIAALFAMAFNLLCGQAGLLSFGHAAYFGIGAFAAVHAMQALGGNGLLPTPLLPLAGAVAGGSTGLAAGWFSTKRSGLYFSMITLALAELLHALAPQLKGLFGGEAGLSTMRQPAFGLSFGSTLHVYYLTLAWVLLSVWLLYLLTRTPVGRVQNGLRENPHRLRFLGYDVHRQSVFVFAVSATFAGIAGALQAIGNESASYTLFELGLSADVVLNAYIGGVGIFLGPAIGAALMTFLGHALSDLTRAWLLYQGVLFVLVMMFFPGGLGGLARLAADRRLQRAGPVVLVSSLAAALLSGAALVLTVELVQRIASQEYQALRTPGAAWPAVPFLGVRWLPGAATTWSVPLLLAGAGAWAGRLARRHWRRREADAREADAHEADTREAAPDDAAPADAVLLSLRQERP
ncbi:MAG: branched-chain amino acid ABC transporter permease [Burkholderiaceae bacterium]